MLSSTNRPDRGSEYLPRPTGGATRFEFEWNCQLEFLSWTITWRREPPFAHFSNGIQTAYEWLSSSRSPLPNSGRLGVHQRRLCQTKIRTLRTSDVRNSIRCPEQNHRNSNGSGDLPAQKTHRHICVPMCAVVAGADRRPKVSAKMCVFPLAGGLSVAAISVPHQVR